ncbi:ectomycorrhiza-induced ankyrin-domain/NACHT-domain-containing protein [Lentinula edodes]|nr:ectomycorrhiza-induced ankyrin-domain/NACHT-domain-containing protein [Lentinula edodes]
MFTGAHHFIINGGNFTAISSDESSKIYQWLNAPDCSANHVTALNKKCPGTGEWIYELDEYKKWKAKPGVLWIQGQAGSGKTVLTTTIIQDVHVDQNAVWYHYFDTLDNSGLKSTYHGFLLSLIMQMGLQNEGINPALNTLYKSNKFNKLANVELEKVLETMIKERNHGYIVVDALDECKEAAEVMKWLSIYAGQLWILVTSRLQADSFGKRVIKITLGGKESQFDEDIETYLKSKIDTIPRFKGKTGDYIKETLKKGADGVFRWVECQLRAVQQCTSHTSVKKALDKLPKDLEETYEQALKRCKDQANAEEAQHLLLWLLYAYEPLTKRQFGQILAVDLEEQAVNPSMEFQVELVIDTTLVTVGQYNIVQLAHASVKEYLISYSLQKQTQDLFELNEQLAHDIMTQTTIIYLMQKKNIYHSSFASYSVEKWLSHASKVEEYKLKGKAQDLIHKMLENNTLYFARWEKKYRGYKVRESGTPLYYGALNGLCQVVQKLVSVQNWEAAKRYVNISGGKYGNALQAATYMENEAIVKMLLEKGADVNSQGGEYGNALQAATYTENEAIVKMLLEKGADVNSQGGEYGNALQAATYTENEAIVKMLLEKGADVNSQGGKYGNALQAAIYRENEAIVKMLLEKGADVNEEAGEYGNALHTAVVRENEAIVKLLLENGANVNEQEGQYGYALQAAVYRENEVIVKLLLDNGADANVQGGKYGNALQAAAYWQNEAIVKLLLKNGADANVQGGKYGNALQAAAYRENEAIVKLLLKNGADVNLQGGYFENALQAASSNGNEVIVKLLLENHADVNVHGGKYGNAFQLSISLGYEAIVMLMLDNGADVNAQGGYYRNPLRAALCFGHQTIIKMLLERGARMIAEGEEDMHAHWTASQEVNEANVQTVLTGDAGMIAE